MSNRIYLAAFAAAALVAASLLAAPAAHAASRPINEGGDVRACATSEEAALIFLGARKDRVHRVLDTRGHKVFARNLDDTLAGFGIGDAVHAADREVRSYPTCSLDGQPATFLIEFSKRNHRVQAATWI